VLSFELLDHLFGQTVTGRASVYGGCLSIDEVYKSNGCTNAVDMFYSVFHEHGRNRWRELELMLPPDSIFGCISGCGAQPYALCFDYTFKLYHSAAATERTPAHAEPAYTKQHGVFITPQVEATVSALQALEPLKRAGTTEGRCGHVHHQALRADKGSDDAADARDVQSVGCLACACGSLHAMWDNPNRGEGVFHAFSALAASQVARTAKFASLGLTTVPLPATLLVTDIGCQMETRLRSLSKQLLTCEPAQLSAQPALPDAELITSIGRMTHAVNAMHAESHIWHCLYLYR
jgi:hypothetical protein